MAFVQAQEFQLAGSGCSATATSIVITGFTLPDGTKLTQAMFGTKGFGTLEPGTSREESVSFTGITDNSDGTQTITGVTRGLKFQTPYTEDAALKFKHAGSSIFVLSNTSAFYADQFFNTQDNQEIDGQITFNTEPLSGYGDPTTGLAFATKDYADGLGGATSYNRTVIAGTGGTTIAAGDVVYLDVTDQEWKLADADTAYSVDTQFGIAQGAGTDGSAITNGVLIAGKDETQTGLTPGEGYYVSTTAGALTTTEPTNSVFVGIAESATVLIVDFRNDPIEFITTSAGSVDAGKGVKLNTAGELDVTIIPNGFKPNAGETINGATLPVPVYQNTSDNEVYACDANDTARYKFIGFAITNSTDGNAITVKTSGVVTGFTGLDEGTPYYVSNTVGAISATPGTQEILVGIAISPTSLLIQKGSRYAHGVFSIDSNTETNQVITTGFRPSMIKLTVYLNDDDMSIGTGTWVNGTYAGVSIAVGESSAGRFGTTTTSYITQVFDDTGTYFHRFTVTSVTGTGFTLTDDENDSASSRAIYCRWEAIGEI